MHTVFAQHRLKTVHGSIGQRESQPLPTVLERARLVNESPGFPSINLTDFDLVEWDPAFSRKFVFAVDSHRRPDACRSILNLHDRSLLALDGTTMGMVCGLMILIDSKTLANHFDLSALRQYMEEMTYCRCVVAPLLSKALGY